MATTLVAVTQMTSTPDVAQNLKQAERLVQRAAEAGAKLVILPECFAFLGPEGGLRAISELLPQGGPILEACRAWAKTLGVELLLGGYPECAEDDTRVYNTSVHIDATGELRAAYRKIHLFDVDLADGTVAKESASVKPGEVPVVTETAFGKLGLSICYDLRFPELYRQLVTQGAIALAVPAAFTLHTGKDHWHVLLRARAIESQAYVLAAAQTGHHFERRVSYGHAMIVDPWGCVVAQCGEGEGFVLSALDPEVVSRVRKQLPSLTHRRLG